MNVGRSLTALVGTLVGARALMALAACSASEPPGAEPIVDGAVAVDATPSPVDAASRDADPGFDATPTFDAGGHCAPLVGPCDLVLQDCPASPGGEPQECVVAGSSGARTTACVPVQATQQLPKGRACCPATNEAPANTCLPGLTCVGQPCEDGGPMTGRCSPACCPGEDTACGKSAPEGISGACDISLVDEQNAQLHMVCSYRARCKPFGVEPCGPSQVCLIDDPSGIASCVTSFGKTEGMGCSFSNECADGLYCLETTSTDGGVCRYMCLTPNAILPFDAGQEPERQGPGKGGCSDPQGCTMGGYAGLPGWLSFCRLPDGG